MKTVLMISAYLAHQCYLAQTPVIQWQSSLASCHGPVAGLCDPLQFVVGNCSYIDGISILDTHRGRVSPINSFTSSKSVRSIITDQSGRIVVGFDDDHHIECYFLQEGRARLCWSVAGPDCYGGIILESSGHLLTAWPSGGVGVRDAETGKLLTRTYYDSCEKTIPLGSSNPNADVPAADVVSAITVDSDEHRAITISANGIIRVWALPSLNVMLEIDSLLLDSLALAYCHEREIIYAASPYSAEVSMWSADTGGYLGSLNLNHSGGVIQLVAHPSRNWLACVLSSGDFVVIDCITQTVSLPPNRPRIGRVRQVSWAADGMSMITVGDQTNIWSIREDGTERSSKMTSATTDPKCR